MKSNTTTSKNVNLEVDFDSLYGDTVHVTGLALVRDENNNVIDRIFYKNI